MEAVTHLLNEEILFFPVPAAGVFLDHMFVLPEYIGKRIGTHLFRHMQKCTIGKRISILSDPNARGFYLKMGCRYIKEFPSTIEGRTTPFLVYEQ